MDARPYQAADREQCLALLERRGLAGQRDAFLAALADASHTFVVLEHEAALMGCGGLRQAGGDEAELVWGMIDPAWERRGLGRYLLLYRTRLCRANFLAVEPPAEFVDFYEKAGFRRVGEGDRLVKKMQVCA